MIIALQRDGAATELRQLFDAEHQHGVVLVGQHRVACQVHAGGAAGAGVLDVVDRDAVEPEIANDHLSEDHAAEHVGAVDRLNVARLHAGVVHRGKDGALSQFGSKHTGVAAERRHCGTGDVDVLHAFAPESACANT